MVLCLPQHLPSGLARAVRSAAAEDWDWETFPLDTNDRRAPALQIYTKFVPAADDPPGLVRNAATLAGEREFFERIIWIDELTEDSWPTWSDFLVEYQHACQVREPVDRSLFCVPLIGGVANCPPPEDVCLVHHRWEGTVDQFDMLLFAANLIHGQCWSPVQRRLAVAIATQLALWDPEVTVRLLADDFVHILRPEPLLRELAVERNWSDLDSDHTAHGWHRGVTNLFDGQTHVHSAAMLLGEPSDPGGEIERRIWTAQVGVMLPFVEEHRRLIVERFGRAFRLPHYLPNTKLEPIREARDLELAHILYQMEYQHVDLGKEVLANVRWLKNIRDRLAHLQTLPPNLLTAHDLVF